jgi:hypothetical protein
MAGIIKRTLLPLLLVVLLASVFFQGAYGILFFADDFQFLNLSKEFSLSWFLPGKEYFYRPLSTEVFYFTIQQFPNPVLAGHAFTFFVFATGVVYLFKTARLVSSSHIFAFFVSAMYLLHLSHVYQLYWLATFQEVLMTTSLIIASYAALRVHFVISAIFVGIAMLSKETAAVYPLFVAMVLVVIPSLRTRKSLLYSAALVLMSIGAVLMYVSGILQNEARETAYQLQPNLSLAINNGVWYVLWSMGLPHNLSDYMPSLIGLPLPRFYEFLNDPQFRWYLILLFAYLSLFAGMAGTMVVRALFLLRMSKSTVRKSIVNEFVHRVLPVSVIATGIIVLFLLPFLFIQHKWMVRLTLPLIGIVIMQAIVYWFYWKHGRWGKSLTIVMLILYASWNYLGVQVHEEVSTYKLETRIVRQTTEYLATLEPFLQNGDTLYFVDSKDTLMSAWDGSQKLKVTLSDQAFLKYYLPDLELIAKYQTDHSHQKQPSAPGRIIFINSNSLIPK